MKKAAIIGTAAFYLFLTTGMFVCTVHCLAGHFLSVRESSRTESCMSHHTAGKKEKPGDCCSGHDIYVVKENINPSFVTKVPENLFVSISPSYYNIHFLIQDPVLNSTLQNSHSPPDIYSPPIFIKIHTLLI
jgi:hypothetical protein